MMTMVELMVMEVASLGDVASEFITDRIFSMRFKIGYSIVSYCGMNKICK